MENIVSETQSVLEEPSISTFRISHTLWTILHMMACRAQLVQWMRSDDHQVRFRFTQKAEDCLVEDEHFCYVISQNSEVSWRTPLRFIPVRLLCLGCFERCVIHKSTEIFKDEIEADVHEVETQTISNLLKSRMRYTVKQVAKVLCISISLIAIWISKVCMAHTINKIATIP